MVVPVKGTSMTITSLRTNAFQLSESAQTAHVESTHAMPSSA